MRAEPSFERVQLLRAAPSPEGPALRRANPEAYDADAPEEQPSSRGGFLRLVIVLVVMCVLGVALAVAWRATGSSGARLWPALASQSSPSAGADPAGQLDRVTKELEALKATVGELSAAQQQMSATLAALQAAEEKLRATQNELQQRTTGLPAVPSGSSPASNALRANTPPPPAAAVTPPRAAAPAPRPAASPPAQATPPALVSPPALIRP